jgi:hypothetical protein
MASCPHLARNLNSSPTDRNDDARRMRWQLRLKRLGPIGNCPGDNDND